MSVLLNSIQYNTGGPCKCNKKEKTKQEHTCHQTDRKGRFKIVFIYRPYEEKESTREF